MDPNVLKAFYMQFGLSEVMRRIFEGNSEPFEWAMMQHENFTEKLYQLDQERRAGNWEAG